MAIPALFLLAQLGAGCASSEKSGGHDDASEPNEDDDFQDDTQEDEGPTWYTNVKPLMESHCVACHAEGEVGTFALDTYDAVSIVSEYVADAVEDRRMPPWRAAEGCTDYRDDIQLSEDEIDTIVEWIDNGKAEGDISLAKTGQPIAVEGLERVDFSLELPVPYTPDDSESDDYRCFPVPWPVDEDVFVTGFQVNPDQAALVHHVIAYVADAGYGEALLAEEAEDGQPGYTCFGGPGVIDQSQADWLGAWAPGATQGNFPNGVGVPMDAGSWIILQVHYNNVAGANAPDQTSIDFQVELDAERIGWIQPFTDPSWLDGSSMSIPAGVEGVRHDFEFEMGMSLDIHSANLHMHRLGKAAEMTLTKAVGTEDCLIRIDDWDFNWQRSYVFDEKKTLEAGDVLRIECEWDNPTDEDVNWGDGTSDEMCLGSILMSLP
jgi:hypothetical protein